MCIRFVSAIPIPETACVAASAPPAARAAAAISRRTADPATRRRIDRSVAPWSRGSAVRHQ
jgi:hypothetical protein